MAAVDVSAWVEFRVGDLFDVVLSSDDLQPKNLNEGQMPLVSSGRNNNGICAMVDETIDANIFEASTITVDMFGKAFYQPDEYFAVSHGRINILKPHVALTEAQGLYLQSVLDSVLDGSYSYSRMCTSKKLADDAIKLPATDDGQPDWAYMEAYMGSVMERQAAVVDALSRMATEKRPVDVGSWVEFRVGDLFETVKDGKQVPTGSMIAMRDLEDGDVDRITVSDRGNGVTGQYAITSDKFNVYENFISVSFLGSVFYHAGKASLDMKVHCLKPLGLTLNESTGLFLASIIRKVLYGLNYTNQISSSMLPDLRIRLPATLDGEPDWAYMEEYMRAVMERQEHVVEVLSRICKH